jgi:hypothetical protein
VNKSKKLAICAVSIFALTLSACSDKDDETNLAFVEVTTPTSNQSGDITITFRLRDKDGRLVNVFPRVISGGVEQGLTVAANSGPTIALRADSFGVTHNIVWDSFADLGAGLHTAVNIRFDPVGRDGPSRAFLTNPFVVNNSDGFRVIDGDVVPTLTGALSAQFPGSQVFLGLGRDSTGLAQSGSFLYDLSSNAVRPGPTLLTFRVSAQASRSARGVLIAGGRNNSALVSAGEEVIIDSASPDGRVELVGALQNPRDQFRMTSLIDGRVIVSGGQDDSGLVNQLEIFSNGSFQVAATDALLARRNHTATRLLDGRILIAGGFDAGNNPLNTSAFITISGLTATVAAGPTMNSPRARHGASILGDGRVAMVAGTNNQDESGALGTAEIFDPNTGLGFLLFAGNLTEPRVDPTVMASGDDITIVGGLTAANMPSTMAERIDGSNGSFATPRFPSISGRTASDAFQLGNGRYLLFGGGVQPEFFIPFQSIESEFFREAIGAPTGVFNAPVVTFEGLSEINFYGGEDANGLTDRIEAFFIPDARTDSRGTLLVPRSRHTANRIDDVIAGETLIVGGRTPTGVTNTAETHNLITSTTQALPPMQFARENHRAVRLADRRLLIIGGRDGAGMPLSTVEAYDPVAQSWETVGPMGTERADHQAILLPTSNEVLVVGGVNAAGTILNSAELFDPTTNTFRAVANTMSRGRQSAVLVFDTGLVTVAVVGGNDGTGATANADLFDVTNSNFNGTITMQLARMGGTSVQYSFGKALIVGGLNGNTDVRPELLDLGTDAINAVGRLPADPTELVVRRGAVAGTLGGAVVIVGGRSPDGQVITGLEFFVP